MDLRIETLAAERRDTILNAALKEFVLRGFEGASTNVIAAEAGMSKALMFHYVGSKRELFEYVCDFFGELLEQEYFGRMDFDEADVFSRQQQSYLLQLELLRRYPWILEFDKLAAAAFSAGIEVKRPLCGERLFEITDISRFREGLDVKKCRQLIVWANAGFVSQLVERIRGDECFDYQTVAGEIDDFIAGMRQVFYG